MKSREIGLEHVLLGDWIGQDGLESYVVSGFSRTQECGLQWPVHVPELVRRVQCRDNPPVPKREFAGNRFGMPLASGF